jgi:hypothetical protein
VVGDIRYKSLAIESGAFFDGRLMQVRGNGQTSEKLEWKSMRQTEKASPAALKGLWKPISPRPANRVVFSLSTYTPAAGAVTLALQTPLGEFGLRCTQRVKEEAPEGYPRGFSA